MVIFCSFRILSCIIRASLKLRNSEPLRGGLASDDALDERVFVRRLSASQHSQSRPDLVQLCLRDFSVCISNSANLPPFILRNYCSFPTSRWIPSPREPRSPLPVREFGRTWRWLWPCWGYRPSPFWLWCLPACTSLSPRALRDGPDPGKQKNRRSWWKVRNANNYLKPTLMSLNTES